MSKVIVYTRPDGGVSILHPAPGIEPEAVLAKDVPPDATDVEVIEKTEVPADRTFRDAWKKSAGKVNVDMPKARDIHMARIRTSRDKALDKLDKDFTKALGQKKNAEVDTIEAKRQALRDIPQAFDLSAAQTPEELKALWPTGLEK